MTSDLIEIAPLPADFDDWAELLDLLRRSFASMDGIIDPPSSVHHLTTAGLKAKAAAETILVAWAGTRLVGCAALAERDDHLYLGKLAVDPAWQGRGIGRRLVQAAEDVALTLSRPALVLQTRVALTGNHRAFAKMGFRETGRTAHPGFDRPTSITLRKDFA